MTPRAASLLLASALLAGCWSYPNVTLYSAPHPPIDAAQVQVVNAPPQGAQRMAEVFAWSPYPVDGGLGYDDAVTKLRARAASIGANVLYVPPKSQIEWPITRQIWMSPDALFRDGTYERPSELKGQAYFRAP